MTLAQIYKQIYPTVKQVHVLSSNYIQYIDKNNNFKEIQFCYKKKLWYEFKTTGTASNPIETIIKYL